MKAHLLLLLIIFLLAISCVRDPFSTVDGKYLDYEGTWTPVSYTVDGVDSMEVLKKIYFQEMQLKSLVHNGYRERDLANSFITGSDSILRFNYQLAYSVYDDKFDFGVLRLDIDSLLTGHIKRDLQSIPYNFMPLFGAAPQIWTVSEFSKNASFSISTTFKNKNYKLKLLKK